MGSAEHVSGVSNLNFIRHPGLAGPVVTLMCLCSFSAHAQTPEEFGKEIAEEHCSRCHIVDDSKPFTGISSTPSFSLLVRALGDWEDRFSTFYARRPHLAFTRVDELENSLAKLPSVKPVEIKIEDVENIVAFVRTLKKTQ